MLSLLVPAPRDPEWSVTLGGIATPHICHSRPPSLKTHKYINAKIHKSKNTQIQKYTNTVTLGGIAKPHICHSRPYYVFLSLQIPDTNKDLDGHTLRVDTPPVSLPSLTFLDLFTQILTKPWSSFSPRSAPLPLPTLMIFNNISSFNTAARRIYLPHSQSESNQI